MRGLVGVTLAFLFLSTVASPVRGLRCGWQNHGLRCPEGECCSKDGYCGRTEDFCALDKACQSTCWWWPYPEWNVTALCHKYEPEKHNWNMTEVGVKCASSDGNKPLWWRSHHYWTGYCAYYNATCGSCLKVTNRDPGQKNSVIVRMVDTCSGEPPRLELDVAACNALDPKKPDRLMVDYKFVNCHDVPPNYDGKDALLSIIDTV